MSTMKATPLPGITIVSSTIVMVDNDNFFLIESVVVALDKHCCRASGS